MLSTESVATLILPLVKNLPPISRSVNVVIPLLAELIIDILTFALILSPVNKVKALLPPVIVLIKIAPVLSVALVSMMVSLAKVTSTKANTSLEL